MKDLILKYNAAVPRYTSYPTAPHFGSLESPAVAGWLAAVDPARPLSLYLHVPFCREMCWYCGCHTKATRHDEPVTRYAHDLVAEAALLGKTLGFRPQVAHLHFGGGSPSLLTPEAFATVMTGIRKSFDLSGAPEIALEADPRGVTPDRVLAYAAAGVNRASFGLQDFTPQVQKAINRVQDFSVVNRAFGLFRAQGIKNLNADLMYGLPLQTTQNLLDTVDQTLELGPTRIALFGYAHVPWMKKHMRLIRDEDLPDPAERADQFAAAALKLEQNGYRAIGLDHFALPSDALTAALENKTLARNFQGYTTDDQETLLGLGVSAISRLNPGFAQNLTDIGPWREAIGQGRLPVARGRALTPEDRLRASVISDLMCYFTVDLDEQATRHGQEAAIFDAVLRDLGDMVQDGILSIRERRLTVHPDARQLVRVVAARFDAYLAPGAKRHSQAA